MTRRFVLFGLLTAAAGIAVLVRTAAPNVESVSSVAPAPEPISAVVAIRLDDCAIERERGPDLASTEVAQLIPLIPLATAEFFDPLSSVLTSTSGARSFESERPPQQLHLSRFTIRPPPSSHAA